MFSDKNLLPTIVALTADPVPNVRFNAARAMQAMRKASSGVSASALEDHIRPCLSRLVADDDPDVKAFAKMAMMELGVKI